jgi:hypothetical protein
MSRVLKQGGGHLQAGSPASAIEEFGLHWAPVRSPIEPVEAACQLELACSVKAQESRKSSRLTATV